MALKTTNILSQLPNELTVQKVEKQPHFIEIFISYPDPEERICPKCGSLNCVIKDRRVQTVHHVPLNKTGTALTFKRIRFRCKDCDATFSDTPYWLHPSLHMTTDLYLSIWVDLTDMHSKKDIALNNCVTVSIVESVINELSFDRPTTLPQTLCIDEFKGSSGIWNPYRRKWEKDRFHCNISNGDNGSVIDILPRMDKPYLTEYFRQFPLSERQKVLFVTCDMHGGYISLAKDMFPNVTICVDMFHIIKLLNSKIDSIRNALQKELLSKDDEETYKTLKNSRRMLLTAEDNQETYWKWKLERRKERIEELLQLSPDLREAYEALQSFHQIVRTEKYSTQ